MQIRFGFQPARLTQSRMVALASRHDMSVQHQEVRIDFGRLEACLVIVHRRVCLTRCGIIVVILIILSGWKGPVVVYLDPAASTYISHRTCRSAAARTAFTAVHSLSQKVFLEFGIEEGVQSRQAGTAYRAQEAQRLALLFSHD